MVDSKLLLLSLITSYSCGQRGQRNKDNEGKELNIICHPHCCFCYNLMMPLKAKKYVGFY